MSATLIRSSLKYHGGKQDLAEWILSLKPKKYLTYCEPCFGAGHVLFRHDGTGKSEVVNDIDDELMNFWAVLRSKEMFDEFARCLSLTPFAQPMFEYAKDVTEGNHLAAKMCNSSIGKAIVFFINCRQSRQGLGEDFATVSKSRVRRGMNEQISAYLSAVDGLLDVHNRLQKVLLFREDFLTFIKRMDHSLTWFYIDPTYLPSTRTSPQVYKHEMTEKQHEEMLELLGTIKGKFALSGYYSKLYADAAQYFGWHIYTKEVKLKSSSKASKEIKTECVWTNYAA